MQGVSACTGQERTCERVQGVSVHGVSGRRGAQGTRDSDATAGNPSGCRAGGTGSTWGTTRGAREGGEGAPRARCGRAWGRCWSTVREGGVHYFDDNFPVFGAVRILVSSSPSTELLRVVDTTIVF